MLDASYIVQSNQGSSGASAVTTISPTLSSASTEGNVIMVFMGVLHPTLTPTPIPTPVDSWYNAYNLGATAPNPSAYHSSLQTVGGETSFVFNLSSACRVAWLILEMSGLASMGAIAGEPAFDYLAMSAGAATDVGPCDTFTNFVDSKSGDEVFFVIGAKRGATGAPPTITSVDPVSPMTTTFAQVGSGATTTMATDNVRIAVYAGYAGGTPTIVDAAVSFSGNGMNIALIVGYCAFWVAPERSVGRQSPNSTTM